MDARLLKSRLKFWKSISWLRFRKNRGSVLGLFVIIVYGVTALASPFIAKYDPYKLGVGKSFTSPSLDHLFGTDDLGRDTFSRVIYGARVSMAVGIIAAITSLVIGVLIGSISGYYGGILDDVLMRVTEIFQVIPRFVLALVIVAFLGSNIFNIMIVIGILSWPSISRLVRGQFLSLKEREYVEAAVADGVSNFRIIFYEILPNAIPPVIAVTMLQIGSAIIMEAGLSFLGLGDPTVISWGRLLAEAQLTFRRGWWLPVFPGLAISCASIALTLVGDGINDVVNPKLRER